MPPLICFPSHAPYRPSAPPPRRSPRPPSPTALILLAALLLAVSASPARSQPPTDPARLGLEPRPFTVESLGLQMHPPAGAFYQAQRIGDTVSVTLADGGDVPTWSMRIQVMKSTLPDPTPAQQITQLQESWKAVGRDFAVITDQPARYTGRDGRLCYLRHALDDGDAVIVGWLVLPFADRSFLVLGMQIVPDAFPHARAVLEASFSTLRLRPVTDIAADRKRRLEDGRTFLENLTPERLGTLIRPGQWFRYYMPASLTDSGATQELGCMYVEFIEAKRGAVNPTRDENDYDPSDHRMGLMARVRGRIIDKANNATVDSLAFYWLAWDQSEERWSVKVTTRAAGRSTSDAQTGVRTAPTVADPRGTITVIDSDIARSRDESAWHTPDVYLSQALRWGLGRLLPRDNPDITTAREYSYYCFDGATSSLSLRIDRWGPATDDSGNWVLFSQPKSDTAGITTIYDPKGDLLRRTWTNGSISEPITLEALYNLWRSKGLRTEDLR